MMTTIDIPDPLYKRVKILAVERGQSLKDIVVASLVRELDMPLAAAEPKISYWANRKLHPGFKRLLESGRLGGGTESTQIISEERSSRDEGAAR